MARSTHGVEWSVLAMTRLSEIGPIWKGEALDWTNMVQGLCTGISGGQLDLEVSRTEPEFGLWWWFVLPF